MWRVFTSEKTGVNNLTAGRAYCGNSKNRRAQLTKYRPDNRFYRISQFKPQAFTRLVNSTDFTKLANFSKLVDFSDFTRLVNSIGPPRLANLTEWGNLSNWNQTRIFLYRRLDFFVSLADYKTILTYILFELISTCSKLNAK